MFAMMIVSVWLVKMLEIFALFSDCFPYLLGKESRCSLIIFDFSNDLSDSYILAIFIEFFWCFAAELNYASLDEKSSMPIRLRTLV